MRLLPYLYKQKWFNMYFFMPICEQNAVQLNTKHYILWNIRISVLPVLPVQQLNIPVLMHVVLPRIYLGIIMLFVMSITLSINYIRKQPMLINLRQRNILPKWNSESVHNTVRISVFALSNSSGDSSFYIVRAVRICDWQADSKLHINMQLHQ